MPEKCEQLFQELLQLYPPEEHEGLKRVYEFSRRSHEGQYRKTGEIFLHHPLHVALILAHLGFDLVTIKASLLHDILEDCQITYEELEDTFGYTLAKIVNGVTKITALDNEIVDKDTQKEHSRYGSFLKFIFAISEDIRVVVVKLADRLHNLRTLRGMRKDKRTRIARETMDIYVPLANRLGLIRLKNEMEDLCLKYLEPTAYYKIKNLVEEKRENRESKIQAAKEYLEKKIAPYNVPVKIEGRPKHFYSIYCKMTKRRLSFDEIFDLLGLRLITDTKEHCYLLLGIIHDIWQPRGSRFKDYIASPKPNNYQSLHTTVVDSEGNLIEVQIRTKEMDDIAEKGIAAHWSYKEESQVSLKDQSFYNFLLELIESTRQEKNAQDSYNNIKDNLLVNTIFVRTPQGKVIELPQGATPVDFAYVIHTEVGNTCVGAKVNGRLVPLSHKLKTEDVVRIITNKQSHPSPNWLELVATSRARNKIRHWLRQSRMDLYLEEGKMLVQKGLKSFSLNMTLNQFIKKHLTSANLQKLNYQDVDSLLIDIGQHQLKITTLFSRLKLLPEEEPSRSTVEKKELPKEVIEKNLKNKISGVDNIHTELAKCCNPRLNNPIQGIVTSSKKVTIHRRNCRNVLQVPEDKRVAVFWETAGYKKKVKKSCWQAGLFIDEKVPPVLEGIAALNFHRARCCYPEESDELKGFYSKIRRGISIHKKSCYHVFRRFLNQGDVFQIYLQNEKQALVKMRVELPYMKLIHPFLKIFVPYRIVMYSFHRYKEGKNIHIDIDFSFLSLNNSGINDTMSKLKTEISGLHDQINLNV